MTDRSRTERVSMNPKKTISSSPAFPIPVGFVVSTLVTGGAERQLQHLILNLDRKRFEPHLYTLRGPGPIGELIASRGIPVESNLGPGRPPVPWSPLKLARRQRQVGIQIYYCLDHTNAVAVAVLASKLAGRIPILMPVLTSGQWNRASIPKPMKMVMGSVINEQLALPEPSEREDTSDIIDIDVEAVPVDADPLQFRDSFIKCM